MPTLCSQHPWTAFWPSPSSHQTLLQGQLKWHPSRGAVPDLSPSSRTGLCEACASPARRSLCSNRLLRAQGRGFASAGLVSPQGPHPGHVIQSQSPLVGGGRRGQTRAKCFEMARDTSPKELGTHTQKEVSSEWGERAPRVGGSRGASVQQVLRAGGETEHVEDSQAEPGGRRPAAAGGTRLLAPAQGHPPTGAQGHLDSGRHCPWGISKALG